MAQIKSYLLDTQVYLWWLAGDPRLTQNAQKILKNPDFPAYLSVASVWEIVIKQAKGKLQLSKDLEWIINKSNFRILSIELPHVLHLKQLPDYHRDPFDRILISQALSEKFTLITGDAKIWQYPVDLVKVNK